MIRLLPGDNREALRCLPPNSVDSVVTDPPYGLGEPPDPLEMLRAWMTEGHLDVRGRGFMGRGWDAFVPQPATWREVFRVLKPGGHVVAFFGTRTYDLGVLAIRLAGFEIRDQLAWIYGSGFPKSHDVSKGIDKALGYERSKVRHRARPATSGTMAGSSDTRPWIVKSRESGFHEAASGEAASDEAAGWQGWGTALKTAWEPIVFARKPLVGSVAANVLAHGTGALNIDGCRVGSDLRSRSRSTGEKISENTSMAGGNYAREFAGVVEGRWPANIVHDGSDEVVSLFPYTKSGKPGTMRLGVNTSSAYGVESRGHGTLMTGFGDEGSAARFFYCAKATTADRAGSEHPTVKPVALMRWLCRLVTPPGGTLLDPFAGSGTTGEAARLEGFDAVLMEREPQFIADIERRLGIRAARASLAPLAGLIWSNLP